LYFACVWGRRAAAAAAAQIASLIRHKHDIQKLPIDVELRVVGRQTVKTYVLAADRKISCKHQ